jgi:hypothetical protein
MKVLCVKLWWRMVYYEEGVCIFFEHMLGRQLCHVFKTYQCVLFSVMYIHSI